MTNSNEPHVCDGLSRALRNALRAAYGSPPFLVQHGWRQRYVDRHSEEVDAFSEPMPPVRPLSTGSNTQTRDDGFGPVVMRTFEVRITDPELSASELMTAFRGRPNNFVPRHIAGFVRGDDDVDSMFPGDEFVAVSATVYLASNIVFNASVALVAGAVITALACWSWFFLLIVIFRSQGTRDG